MAFQSPLFALLYLSFLNRGRNLIHFHEIEVGFVAFSSLNFVSFWCSLFSGQIWEWGHYQRTGFWFRELWYLQELLCQRHQALLLKFVKGKMVQSIMGEDVYIQNFIVFFNLMLYKFKVDKRSCCQNQHSFTCPWRLMLLLITFCLMFIDKLYKFWSWNSSIWANTMSP